MREREIETFTVEFGAPADIEWPWEVTLMFDRHGKIISIKQGCDVLAPIGKVGDDHHDCPPGTCGRKIGSYYVCSSAYCSG